MTSQLQWRKSSRSGPNTPNCVEVAFSPAGVHVRNSNHPDGATVTFTDAEWDAFIPGVIDGEFNRPTAA